MKENIAAEPKAKEKAESTKKFDMEEWKSEKKKIRDEFFRNTDECAKKVLSDTGKLKEYLMLESRLPDYSVNNLLAVFRQVPEATFLTTAERWNRRGDRINRGEKAVKIMQFEKYYQKPDGTRMPVYEVENVFDVSQTTAGRMDVKKESHSNAARLRALVTDVDATIVIADDVPYDAEATYDSRDNVIEVCNGLEPDRLFTVLTTKIARSDLNERASDEQKDFDAGCVAYIVCTANDVDTEGLITAIPEDVSKKDASECKEELKAIRSSAAMIQGRITRILSQEKEMEGMVSVPEK